MTSIACNLEAVRARIDEACIDCGRDPFEFALLPATKTQPVDRIKEAALAGSFLTGENRVQELVDKASALAHHGIERRLIGHLQSNKAGKALDRVTCEQSIDRLSIAKKLNPRFSSLSLIPASFGRCFHAISIR